MQQMLEIQQLLHLSNARGLIMGYCSAGVVVALLISHAGFLVSVHGCTISKYIMSHCFQVQDNNLMSSDPIFGFIMFTVSQATVYAAYYTVFKCCAEGRIINFLMGFPEAFIAVRLECLTM